MKYSLYIISAIIFLVVYFLSFAAIMLIGSLIFPNIWKWSTHTHPFLKILVVPYFGIILAITITIHNKLKNYVAEHGVKEAAIGFFQILGVAFLMLLHIANLLIRILFPLAVIYLAYHFLTH